MNSTNNMNRGSFTDILEPEGRSMSQGCSMSTIRQVLVILISLATGQVTFYSTVLHNEPACPQRFSLKVIMLFE